MRRRTVTKSPPTSEMQSASSYTEYTTENAYVVTGGTPQSPVTYDDVTGVSTTGGSATNDFTVTPEPDVNIGVSSSDTTVATVTGDGITRTVNYISDGNATISVWSGDKRASKFNYAANSIASVNTYEVTAYDSGSLQESVHNTIAALISGKTPSTTTQYVFSSYDDSDFDSPTVVRNTSLFLTPATYDLTGISVMRDDAFSRNYGYPCALVTTRHALAAKHTARPSGIETFIGRRFKFLDSLGSFQDVEVIGQQDIGIDISVLLFDTDLTNCKVYDVLSDTQMSTYLPSIINRTFDATYSPSYYGYGALPIIRTSPWEMDLSLAGNQLIKTAHATYVTTNAGHISIIPDFDWAVMGDIPDWSSLLKGGDSGGACFIPYNNDLIYIGPLYGGTINGTYEHTAEINTAMNDLSGVAQGTYALSHPTISTTAY